MLDVNDFNAVRISLASPEQIRSWSYGEVTKPETINYRTLKPEKDGLFCEKIFGPTKDFECYCGKYKRVRYKGIVCDKCGVEVTRSKVRRERMGHIELSSPVSHIWFVKGTPSRISLLLDISPRSLERVIYFAQFVVTKVDELARRRAVGQIREEADRERTRLGEVLKTELEGIRRELDTERQRRSAELEQKYAAEDEALFSQISDLSDRLKVTEDRISELQGQKAPETVAVDIEPVVAEGETVEPRHLAKVRQLLETQVAELEAATKQRKADLKLLMDADLERVTHEFTQRSEPVQKRLNEINTEREKGSKEVENRVAVLEDLHPGKLIAENDFRDLREIYGPVATAGMGAESVLELLQDLDLNELRDRLQREVQSSSGQRRKKATKRLRVVEAFRKSANKPDWMIMTVLPVLPPDLRPMVQLDGGRFATSDLNDLYRRVINRNNRLRRLLELGAPEIIIRNEKRMLQEAVDSLIDNGRRGRAVAGTGNHKLKSLSDMLKGKQGRFRQNLLGKRVDYSGRSVIVVGPSLRLNQCGLPKRMALELFKPFVMRRLVERGLAHNIKSAKRIVERVKPEVWDVLEEVITERPVLLNRAPTLHRLGIQAFEPVLIEGSAIQIHPLVCTAFNADFDGDQMAVHVPLSRYAVEESRRLMMSTRNLLSPSSGEPIVSPTLDMVLGCYYLSVIRAETKGEGMTFASRDEAKLAYDMGLIDLQARILVRDASFAGGRLETSVGRIIFNDVLPPQLGYRNEVMDKGSLKKLVADCYRLIGNDETALVVDDIKRIGFNYATRSGITIAVNDLNINVPKRGILDRAEQLINEAQADFNRGLITEQERYQSTISAWEEATGSMQRELQKTMNPYSSLFMMMQSGAKGNIKQVLQMAGMRGLMSDPTGRIIELPIKSSFREGLTVLEYFISTHGARKGLADTALRTADSGYLTRRLIDVAQDVIVLTDDCGTQAGIWIMDGKERGLSEPLQDRIIGRVLALDVVHPETGEIIERNTLLDEELSAAVVAAVTADPDPKNHKVYVRTPMVCQARRGICQLCYGWSLAVRRMVELREAVGIVGAQSIGEPGTQLTMRTFHTGGVAEFGGKMDITQGLPRVEELFEARVPKGQSIVSEIDGVVEILQQGDLRKIRVNSSEVYEDEQTVPDGWDLLVTPGQQVDTNTILARDPAVELPSDTHALATLEEGVLRSQSIGKVSIHQAGDVHRVVVAYEEREEREYSIPAAAQIRVENGARVRAGEQLTDGNINPQDLLRILGRDEVQRYLVDEVQKVYRAQGVSINDKHIETIARQMLRRVRVDMPGDTDLLPGELVDRFQYEEINAKVLSEGGEPATAETVLLGVTKASLNTDSFLAAASFQETTRVLAEAAVNGSVDRLQGLKENVIIGKLIPARGLEFLEAPRLAAPALEIVQGVGQLAGAASATED